MGQQHQAHPLQSGGHHHPVVGGAHGIPVASFGSNLSPPAPFHGFVNPENQRLGGGTQLAEQPEQQCPAQMQWGPSGTVENVMESRKVSALPHPQDVEGGRYGALAGRQDRSYRQELGFAPSPGVNRGSKGSSRDAMTSGRVGIFDLLWCFGRAYPVLVFCLDFVQSRGSEDDIQKVP